MKKIMLQIVVMVIANMTIVFAQDYRVNDIVITDHWRWVDVVNPKPVQSANYEFSFGATCGIGGGDKLQIIGIDGDNYLLRVEKRNSASGTSCPNGILFFMDFSTVESMKGVFRKKKVAERETKKKVEEFIEKHDEGE